MLGARAMLDRGDAADRGAARAAARRRAGAGLLAAAALAALSGCSAGAAGAAPAARTPAGAASGGAAGRAASAVCPAGAGTLNLAGSTEQAAAVQKFGADFRAACPGSTVNYNGSGARSGLVSFEQKQIDIAGADFPLGPQNRGAADGACGGADAVDLPLDAAPIAVVYRLPGLDKPLNLKAATLARILAGRIGSWNDPEIAAQNPGAALPATAISTVHRSDASGATYGLSAYLNALDPAGFPAADRGWPAPGGRGESGAAAVAQAVAATDGAIGYTDPADARQAGLPAANLGNAKGQYAPADPAAAAAFLARAKVAQTGRDVQLQPDYGYAAANAYPAIEVGYAIACGAGNSAAQLPLIKSFLAFADGPAEQAGLPAAGYAALPAAVQARVLTAVRALS